MDKQNEYLRLLQERNRLKKLMNAKSKEELAKEELERGFTTHFRAANAVKPDKTAPVVVVNNSKPVAVTSEPVKKQWGKFEPSFNRGEIIAEQVTYGEYSIESEMEQPSEFTADSMEPTFEKSESSRMSLDDTTMLANRISSLDKDRKQRLLEILQRDLQTVEEAPVTIEQPSPQQPPLQQSPAREIVIESSNDAYEEEFPVYASVEAALPTTKQIQSQLPTIQINLKIRIYTTWRKEKFASMAAMRLRLPYVDYVSGVSDCIDALSAFKTRFLSGLTQISNNTDTVRNFSTLTGVNTRFVGDKQPLVTSKTIGDWKVPISAENPVDIIMEGQLSPNVTEIIVNHFSSVDAAMEAFTLKLWNVNESCGLNCSPVKDVDVYVNNKIVWSGEVPPGAKIDRDGSDFELPASISVSLVKDRSKSISISAPLKDIPKVVESKPVVDIFEMSIKNHNLGGGGASLFVDTVNDFAKPDWLTNPTNGPIKATGSPMRNNKMSTQQSDQHGKSPRSNNISFSPLKEAPKRVGSAGRRNRGNIESISTDPLPSQPQIEEVTKDPYGSPDKLSDLLTPMNSSAKKKGRRARPGAGGGDLGVLNQRMSDMNTNTSQSNLTTAEEDSHLRQSLNAVQMSEKFNLGRLSMGESHLPGSATKRSPAAIERSSRLNKLNDHVNETLTGLSQLVGVSPREEAKATSTTAVIGNCLSGSTLVMEIYSTWGDLNYVGLNGIALYDGSGSLLKNTDSSSVFESIEANCEHLKAENGLLEDDPRKVTNLLNGQNFTRNDLHVWLCPQLNSDDTGGSVAIVTIKFSKPQSLSMIRVFNYNKSRTHNQRGVKDCKFMLDDKIIFEGQLKKCSGRLLSAETECDTIYQSTEPSLAAILNKIVHETIGDDNDPLEESAANLPLVRPRTATQQEPAINNGASVDAEKPSDNYSDIILPLDSADSHPDTTPDVLSESNSYLQLLNKFTKLNDKPIPVGMEPLPTVSEKVVTNSEQKSVFAAPCKVFRLEIETTWGDSGYVGLCGVEILSDNNNAPIKLSPQDIDANPKDLSAVGCFDDPRKLENLINGVNDCADDSRMWLIPFTRRAMHWIQFKLPSDSFVTGLRVWNYNKSSEDVLRGAKSVKIIMDGRHICSTIFRCAPGTDGVKFGQTIIFDDLFNAANANLYAETKLITPPIRQDYDVQCTPTGLLWKITIYDNWNDEFYVGLDRFEMYDKSGNVIDLLKCGAQIAAVPHSVQDLGLAIGGDSNSLSKDPRVPSNLFASAAQGRCWLSPLSRCMTSEERISCVRRTHADMQARQGGKLNLSLENLNFPKDNSIFVSFQFPVAVSAIKFFNYSKTASRGVRNFSLDLDGKLLYIGSLLPADREKKAMGYGRTASEFSRGQSIIFSADNRIVQANKDLVYYCGATEQDVLCINERQVMVRANHMFDTTSRNVALEGIEADLSKTPGTSFHHARK